jgi:4-diphosphocytidyl-2-C-methyl-D-erythritol kinase
MIENRKTICYNVTMSVSVKAYAKLNLTLDITGQSGGYHMLDSLVTTIDLGDDITLTKRSDNKIQLTMQGMGSEGILPEQNNATKAARLFVQHYGTTGANINILKHIPMGAGLGGSSADVAGVLRGMAQLYAVHDENGLKQLADSLGSDCGYLLTGGYARMQGRGEQVQSLPQTLPLYALLFLPNGAVSTPACYKKFDELLTHQPFATAQAVQALQNGNAKKLCASLNNMLYPSAVALCHEVAGAVTQAQTLLPDGVNMTGSGSCVYALFAEKSRCEQAFRAYEQLTKTNAQAFNKDNQSIKSTEQDDKACQQQLKILFTQTVTL